MVYKRLNPIKSYGNTTHIHACTHICMQVHMSPCLPKWVTLILLKYLYHKREHNFWKGLYKSYLWRVQSSPCCSWLSMNNDKYITFIWRQRETKLFYRTLSYIGQVSKQRTAVTYFTFIQWSKFLVKIMSFLGQWIIQHANMLIFTSIQSNCRSPPKYFPFGPVHCKEYCSSM